MIECTIAAKYGMEICYLEAGKISASTIAGILFGLIVSILIGFILVFAMRKDKKIKGEYDERQQLVRGKGFKYAFFTMVFYSAAMGFVSMNESLIFMDRCFEGFLGIIIATGVYVLYTLFNDGYLAMNDSRERTMWMLFFIGVLNLVCGIQQTMDGLIIEDGIITYRATNFLCAILLFVVDLAMVIKGLIDRKDEMKEEDE